MLNLQTEIFIVWCVLFALTSVAEGISAKLSFIKIVILGFWGAVAGAIVWFFMVAILLGAYHSVIWTF